VPEMLYHYRIHGMQDSVRERAAILTLSNLAYQKYGRLIWGDDAPDVEFGAPLHRRVLRKLKRMFRGTRRA
jgi:hypothetical protein